MKIRKRTFQLIWGAVSALQIGLLYGGFFLQGLTRSKAGVNHHVAYRKRQWNATLLTSGKTLLLAALLVAITLLLLWLLFRASRRGAVGLIVRTGMGAGESFGLLMLLVLPAGRGLAIYPYALLLGAAILVLQLFLLVLHPSQ